MKYLEKISEARRQKERNGNTIKQLVIESSTEITEEILMALFNIGGMEVRMVRTTVVGVLCTRVVLPAIPTAPMPMGSLRLSQCNLSSSHQGRACPSPLTRHKKESKNMSVKACDRDVSKMEFIKNARDIEVYFLKMMVKKPKRYKLFYQYIIESSMNVAT